MVQGGAPLKMSVGTSDLKSRRNTSVNPLTAKSLMELQSELSCGNEGVKKIAQKIREVFGRKAVAPYATQEAVEGGKTLESFYTITRLKFEVKKTEEVEVKGKDGQVKKVKKVSTVEEERDLIHVKDPSEFVLHACDVRGLDPSKAICRLGMDAGQGSLKGMVNIAEGEDSVEEDEEDGNGDDGKRKADRAKLTGVLGVLGEKKTKSIPSHKRQILSAIFSMMGAQTT